MNMKELKIAENILKKIAAREGKTVSEARKEIQKAMCIGLCSQDQNVQAYWKRIPCEGDVPSPEEVIAFWLMRHTTESHALELSLLVTSRGISPLRT